LAGCPVAVDATAAVAPGELVAARPALGELGIVEEVIEEVPRLAMAD